jgi:hypothetical protein
MQDVKKQFGQSEASQVFRPRRRRREDEPLGGNAAMDRAWQQFGSCTSLSV